MIQIIKLLTNKTLLSNILHKIKASLTHDRHIRYFFCKYKTNQIYTIKLLYLQTRNLID